MIVAVRKQRVDLSQNVPFFVDQCHHSISLVRTQNQNEKDLTKMDEFCMQSLQLHARPTVQPMRTDMMSTAQIKPKRLVYTQHHQRC